MESNFLFSRSLRRGSKDGSSKKSWTGKANGEERGRVAAVQEEVGAKFTWYLSEANIT